MIAQSLFTCSVLFLEPHGIITKEHIQVRQGRCEKVMNQHTTAIHLTPAAQKLLRPGEVLVFEWHRLAMCCAGAGETSISVMKEDAACRRKGLVRVKTNTTATEATDDSPPVYAAWAIFPHLAGRQIKVDARKVFGVRFFTTDLPRDFGLRSIFGRLPQPTP
jgi:hypothetical protein